MIESSKTDNERDAEGRDAVETGGKAVQLASPEKVSPAGSGAEPLSNTNLIHPLPLP